VIRVEHRRRRPDADDIARQARITDRVRGIHRDITFRRSNGNDLRGNARGI
jgi:hypothetical protein